MDNMVKVLAVDDEKFNLLLLQSCLKNGKYELHSCSDALEAISEFQRAPYDCVLLDIMMSGINGLEVRKLIRQSNREIPIIFLTSIVDDLNNTLMNQITGDPYSYYLKKPVSTTQLLKTLDKAVGVYFQQRKANSYYQKLEENLTMAEDVQRAMLPDWCGLTGGMRMSYFYASSHKVSGDVLVQQPIDAHRTVVFIGDISGHGIQAALYTGAIQAFVKMSLFERHDALPEPHEILNRINQFFRNDLAAENYMTGLIALFDFEKNILKLQTAGHPAPFRCNSRTGTADPLEIGDAGGLPIGMQGTRLYVPEDTLEFPFDDDDLFLLYTDGILDLNMPGGEAVDEVNFVSLLGPLAVESDPVTVPFRLRDALARIGYTEIPDDVCLAVIAKGLKSSGEMLRVVPSDTAAVIRVVEEFSQFVGKTYRRDNIANCTELLLSEFLNNIILHGLESRRHSQTGIYVRLIARPDELEIRVVDRGREWNCDTDCNSSEEFFEQRNRSRATSGRGMAIIRSIASGIRRSHYSGVNETVFTIDPKIEQGTEAQ